MTNKNQDLTEIEFQTYLDELQKEFHVKLNKNVIEQLRKEKKTREDYQKSEKGRLARDRYQNSEKGLKARENYHKSPGYKKQQKSYHANYYRAKQTFEKFAKEHGIEI